ncbi:MAG: hypothetical protein RLZZ387_2572 [Chloroflexota bacterium]|jgi:hypothetical protein
MSEYLAYLAKMAEQYGVPLEEARALYELESSSGQNVRDSSAGAIGHMQLMPGTARELGVDPRDPYQNIRGGVQYYAQQRKAFGDPALAAAAYNAGPGRVRRAGGIPRIAETQNYVRRFRDMLGMAQAAPSAIPPAQDQGTTPMQPQTGGLSSIAGSEPDDPRGEYFRLMQEAAALPGEYEQQRKAQFEAAQKRIEQMYSGPSRAATLAALSQAFLSPRRYKGFGGTMLNVSQALGGVAERRDEAARNRQEAMAALESSYGKGSLDAKSSSLKARMDMLKAKMDLEAEQAKAGRPSYQLSPTTGEVVEVPKQAERPRTKAEYDALPIGTYYVVPAGPKMGKVIMKTATGG